MAENPSGPVVGPIPIPPQEATRDSVLVSMLAPEEANDDDQDTFTCRICFEQQKDLKADPDNPLISPCMCTGHSKYVHRDCLKKWRETNHRLDAYYQCEVCKFKFQFRRLWWARLLRSKVAVASVFLPLMFGGCYLVGFIPILGTAGVNLAMHFANGVVITGILGFVLAVVVSFGKSQNARWSHGLPDVCPQCGPALIDCPGSAVIPIGECGAECGLVVLGSMVVIGFLLFCFFLWSLVWGLCKRACEGAQSMVENI